MFMYICNTNVKIIFFPDILKADCMSCFISLEEFVKVITF